MPIKGVVLKFQAINPHMRLVLRVTDAKGTREIEFEGHSTNNMYRAGYRDKMIQVGDTITVYVAPLQGRHRGRLRDGRHHRQGHALRSVVSRMRIQEAEAAREREKAEGGNRQ